MADALWMRIREVNWEEFPAHGGANMSSLLRNLGSRKEPRAMKASQQTWSALCGGDVIAQAAEPSIEFLVEILKIAQPSVQDGILDILNRFSKEDKLVSTLQRFLVELQPLQKSRDPIITEKVKGLLEKLRS